jgi:hypothetical protein
VRKFKILVAILLVIGVTYNIAEAGILDDVMAYVKDRPVKVSYFYEVDNSEFLKLVGTSVKDKLFDVENLDLDLWYKWSDPATEIKYDEIGINNLIMPGLSYGKNFCGWKVGVNAGVGLDRIEKVTDSKDIGELKYGGGVFASKKF